MSDTCMATLVAIRSAISSAPNDIRMAIDDATFPISQHSHHQGNSVDLRTPCQFDGSADASHISFIAWYGFQRFAKGMKYQPTHHPGVNLRPAAPSWRTFTAVRWIHTRIKIAEVMNTAV